jgi:hypothetical protein
MSASGAKRPWRSCSTISAFRRKADMIANVTCCLLDPKPLQEFLGTLVIVVTSEGLVRVDDRKSRGAGGDCKSDSNQYEDFFHGRILSKRAVRTISQPSKYLRQELCEKETTFASRNYSDGAVCPLDAPEVAR